MDAAHAERSHPLLGEAPLVPEWLRMAKLVVVVSAVSIGTSFQFGFGTGVLNNLEHIAPASLAAAGTPLHLWQWSLIVSGFGLGGLIGSCVVAHVSLRFGRKTVLLATNAFVVASSALLMMGSSWPVLLLGRICTGLVAGIGSAVVPMYLAEISPTNVRGAVGTAHQLGITLGCLASFALTTPSLGLLGSEDVWRYTFLVPIFCSLLQCTVLPFCPESPAHVYRTVGSSAALRKLAELHDSASLGGHIDALRGEANVVGLLSEGGFTLSELLGARKLRRHLLVGVVIQLSMQFSGIDAVFYYSTMVFRQAGLADPQLATTLLGVLNVGLTVVAIAIMDKAGRRTLLLISWAGMATSYMLLTISFVCASFGVLGSAVDSIAPLAMAGVITSFAIGPGCIAWFVIAEIFPAYAIDAAMALGVALNWWANWVVAFAFPLLNRMLGPYSFLLFAASTVGFGLFTYWSVPETRLKTASEMHAEFRAYSLS